MTEQLIKIFVVLFVVVEPLSLVPMFGALTSGASVRYRRKMALKSTFLAAIILFVFALSGNWFLGAMSISLDAFKIAGGLLLFMISLDMVFARQSGVRSTTVREQEEARYKEDISVFPLAFPLIAGPGAMATVLLLVGETDNDPVMYVGILGVLLLVLLLTLTFMLLTPVVMRLLGVTGANVISRLLGVVLVALSVQYVIDGVRGSFLL
ncbi:MAG: NAAT family transporter [Gammaproteobacteria bacterium]|nr:NAAT family transporter [Gammaproteobacteria bacterium]